MSSNDLCCVLTIKQKDYEYLTSRFGSYQIHPLQPKQAQLTLLQPHPQNPRQKPSQPRPRKCQSTLLLLSDRSQSHILIAPTVNTPYDQKFIYEASYLRADNNIKSMMEGWSVFGELREVFRVRVDVEGYRWKGLFELEFVHGRDRDRDREGGEILMVVRDCLTTNFVEKGVNANKEYWMWKVVNHFKDMYAMLGSIFMDTSTQPEPQLSNIPQLQPLSLPGQQFNIQIPPLSLPLSQPHSQPTKSKNFQFDERNRIYIEKLLKLVQRQGQKSPQFWIIRVACIVEFVMKEFYCSQDKKEKDREKEREREGLMIPE